MKVSIAPGYLGLCSECGEDMLPGMDTVKVFVPLDIPDIAGLPAIEGIHEYQHSECAARRSAILGRD